MPDITAIARELSRKAMSSYITLALAGKTVNTYTRQLKRSVLDLYKGSIDEFEFIDDVVSQIDNQFGRAFREGAREAGVDTRDFTDEDISVLRARVEQEREFILDFAQAIVDAKGKESPIDPLYSRVDSWANRYNEVRNMARLRFSEERLEWVLGPTEDHCHHNDKPGKFGCANLNGVVATGKEWEAAGVRPQSDTTACGGFHCQCELKPTKKPRTRGGVPRP